MEGGGPDDSVEMLPECDCIFQDNKSCCMNSYWADINETILPQFHQEHVILKCESSTNGTSDRIQNISFLSLTLKLRRNRPHRSIE